MNKYHPVFRMANAFVFYLPFCLPIHKTFKWAQQLLFIITIPTVVLMFLLFVIDCGKKILLRFCLVANKSSVKIEILDLELKHLKKNTINHKSCVSSKIRQKWLSLCVCVWCVCFFQCICVCECGICCDGMFRFDHFHIIFIGRIFLNGYR